LVRDFWEDPSIRFDPIVQISSVSDLEKGSFCELKNGLEWQIVGVMLLYVPLFDLFVLRNIRKSLFF
jgi:hypothetical protein